MKQLNLELSALGSLMIAVGMLGSVPMVRAESGDDAACSNRILRGDYGFAVEGAIIGFGPLRGVAMTHFDGAGKLRQVDHVVVNGIPPAVDWNPGTGTYTVNADCTGTAQINNVQGPQINLRFVVVREGKEIHTVVNDPGYATTSVGIKVEGR